MRDGKGSGGLGLNGSNNADGEKHSLSVSDTEVPVVPSLRGTARISHARCHSLPHHRVYIAATACQTAETCETDMQQEKSPNGNG